MVLLWQRLSQFHITDKDHGDNTDATDINTLTDDRPTHTTNTDVSITDSNEQDNHGITGTDNTTSCMHDLLEGFV